MKSIYKKYLPLFALFLINGCEDALVEDPPSNISLSNFYQSEDDALAGLYGAYSNMYGILPSELLYGDMIADDMTVSPIVPDNITWDEFTYNSDITGGLWSECFSGINRANEVIFYTAGIDFESGRRADIIAEAKALRAFYYFLLVRTMGGVPLYETPTVGFDNIFAPRASEDEIYDLIITDLEHAATELEATGAPGRINADIAQALLARIYLYRGDFSKAYFHAENLISSGRYALLADYAAVFSPENDNSREHLFQLQYLSGETNNPLPGRFAPRTPSAYQNTFWAGTTVPGSYAPSAEFVAENPVSYRRAMTLADHYEHIDGVSGTITMEEIYGDRFPFYISKFDDREAELQSGSNITVIRYADILLIAAEALNEIDPTDNRKYTWINEVRERARNGVLSDLPDLSGLTQDQFRTAVLEERRFELAFEGHRAWDLKRRGLFLEKLRAQGKMVEAYMILFPIPDDQTKLNPNLEQNPGW